MSLRDVSKEWEANAEQWAAWARTPGHDVWFWAWNLPGFAELLPEPGVGTVDVGCGEGRVGRFLAARGHRVWGLDRSPVLTDLARETGGYEEVVCGDATALPWQAQSFDLAISFMCLMDMPDPAAAIRETARVLVPQGRLCLAIGHPFSRDRAKAGSYFVEADFDETVEQEGLTMRFVGRDRPLETYTRALAAAGFVIEELREPRPSSQAVAEHAQLAQAQAFPFFLHIRARLV
jgi:SAM-dependent methyltransferase